MDPNLSPSTSEKYDGRKRVLVAPLDWGLGHATRCIPIIKKLIAQSVDVVVACDGAIKILLQKEFPELTFIHLQGYQITYGKPFLLGMIRQLSTINNAIIREQNWLQETVEKHKIDAVISDNRYGLYHRSIPTYFITHQLQVKTLAGKVIDRLVHERLYKYINRFSECWVPDYLDKINNLAGELSHPVKMPAIPCRYIGPLSRFNKTNKSANNTVPLVLLSGPEPHRTIFEKKIIAQQKKFRISITLVRGLPASTEKLNADGLTAHNYLDAEALQDAISNSSVVIARSGYSTIMDLVRMQKKMILAPTPGQGEQEYLAKHISKKGQAIFVSEKDFDLMREINAANNFTPAFNYMDSDKMLEEVIQSNFG